jgi:hypothetical protein
MSPDCRFGGRPRSATSPIVDRVVGDKPKWYDKSAIYARLDDIEQKLGYAKAYQKAGDAEGLQRFVGENGAELAQLQPLAKWARKEMRRSARPAARIDRSRTISRSGRLDDFAPT